MDSFPIDARFKYSWRSYQERVLSELEEHLDDNHLHIVAAPGSGKTVLGLEVVRRLNRPTIILSPTITIRNQWVDRFVNLFLQVDTKPDWISTDIKNPGFLTVITYQALHSALTGEKEEEKEEFYEEENEEPIPIKNDEPDTNLKVDITDILKKKGIKTIVVDEAHHLRTEWWKSLIKLKDSIEKPRIVALTATPPYDVEPVEWYKYIELCGPIDSEISVPELVKEGNLCPHQDYVYLSMPSKEEEKRIKEFRENVDKIFNELCNNYFFIQSIEQHPWIKWTEPNIEKILEKPDYFSSMLIFLNHAGKELPKEFFEILGISKKRIPKLTYEWMEILLTEMLYNDIENYYDYPENNEEIKKHLSRIGAIERRKIILRNTKEINKILASSITKLDSIIDIVKLEQKNLRDKLRLVILTDYIRKSEMPKSSDDVKSLNRIGVVPIFEKIRREKNIDIKLGILSGTLVIIPRESTDLLKRIANENNIAASKIKIRTLQHDEKFVEVELMGADRQKIVRVITSVFSQGGITVLVGTKALLGEGWDAPSINSIILASFVGSYMLSNQMRGRAIRTQAGNPNKTSNIWHLVCVEPEKLFDTQKEKMGDKTTVDDDYNIMKRRFKAFLGLSFTLPIIENGIQRLNLGDPPFNKSRVSQINQEMEKRAENREKLADQWQEALDNSEEMRINEEISTSAKSLPKRYVYLNSIMMLLWLSLIYLEITILYSGRILVYSIVFPQAILILIFLIIIVVLPFVAKAIYLFLKYGPIAASLKQIGEAVLKTLAFNNLIKTDVNKMGVKTNKTKHSEVVTCGLVGGTSYEKFLFLTCLEEIFGPIENPRYILVRKSTFSFYNRIDYHNVPDIIGRKKEYAEYFSRMWNKYVGPNELVYTRSIYGRKKLLKARSNSMANAFLKRSERKSIWK